MAVHPERRDEEVRREHEREARLAQAAEVDDGQDRQDDEAEEQCVREQRGDRRDERAHARRDAHRDVEHVVERERRPGEERGVGAEVLLGDGVRAAAARVCVDGLTVGEVDDAQDADDERADRPDVREARGAEGDEQRERRLGPVRGRGERVEPQHRDARERADLLVLRFFVREGPTEQPVEDAHGPGVPRGSRRGKEPLAVVRGCTARVRGCTGPHGACHQDVTCR
jgi:hypothetical protein